MFCLMILTIVPPSIVLNPLEGEKRPEPTSVVACTL